MDAIDKAGGAAEPSRLRPASTPVAPAAPATPVATKATAAPEVANLISLLADAQPPVDSKKVEAIQSLISSGAYPIDAHAIAAKMLALDFPSGGGKADA